MDMIKQLFNRPESRFVIVGGLVTILDFVLFTFVANILQISLFELPSRNWGILLSLPICITVNFLVSRKFVWQTTTRKRDTFFQFVALNLFSGILVQSIIIYFAGIILAQLPISGGNISVANLVGKCFATAFSMIINFIGSKFIFSRSSNKQVKSE